MATKRKDQMYAEGREARGLALNVMGKQIDDTLLPMLDIVRTGPKLKIASKEDLEREIHEFWDYIAKKGLEGTYIIPDWFGFASFLRVSTQTLDNYIARDVEGMGEMLRMVKNDIAYFKSQLAMQNKINPMVWTVSMNNQHGFANPKQMIEVKEEKKEEISVERLLKEAELLDNSVIDGEYREK